MATLRAVPGGARKKAHVALFDGTTLLAKGVKEQLVSRKFPVASLRLFTSRNEPDSNLTEFNGEAMLVTEPDPDALGRLDIAFLCGTREEGARYLDWAARKGFMAIDLTTAARAGPGAPLINAGVNPQAIPEAPGLVATPHPIGQFLSTLIDPIQKGCGLESAEAVVFQPASECGDLGIEELYQQTLGLLNFHEVPDHVFGRQLAFNLIPAAAYGPGKVPGGADPAALAREVLEVTGGRFPFSVETILAPVFHCHAALLHVALPAGKNREDLTAALKASPEIQLLPAREPLTPAERAGKPGVSVAAVRPAARGAAFWVWAVTDNLISGTARNAVRIAEALVERGLGRDDS